ncbi:hypothetical protein B9G69_007945 [Bdellovibrio sp. SKB1291214]|uniref:hypothetical protein n=1 Tax=Bdellovibrio sp. SKB1291214 TaxID=1732569 RepID=UPI0020CD04F8|nr:hypothetical protein [Bdellovibrio sp. SKB1291214]UYL10505.1 hypothetical protein B9G69_007945 [Bdellovibrio sp. SKB1291214]
MKSNLLIALFVSVVLAGCQTTGVMLRDTPLNISETRKVIVSVVGEVRDVSENGRELFSKYYDRKGNPIQSMDMAKERYYSHLIVLGDRRPYDISVDVIIEARDSDGTWELVDHDDHKSAVLADKLKKALNQSRDSRNVIDDFRSF